MKVTVPCLTQGMSWVRSLSVRLPQLQTRELTLIAEGYNPVSCTRNELGSRPVCLDLNAIGYLGSAPVRDTFCQFNTNELTLILTLTYKLHRLNQRQKEEATNGRDGVYQLGSRAHQQRHQRKPFHCDASSFHCDASTFHCGASELGFFAAGHLIAFDPLPHLRYLEAGLLLATPTSFWQHHIEPQSAFPQQLLQVTKIFSLRSDTPIGIPTTCRSSSSPT